VAALPAARTALADDVERWVGETEVWSAARTEGTGEAGSAPAPIHLLALSPGLGKTTTAAAAVAATSTPVLVTVPQVVAAQGWTKRTARPGRSVVRHLPRTRPSPSDAAATGIDHRDAPGTCRLMGAVETVGGANHVPAATLCAMCPHGLRAQLLATAAGSEREEAVLAKIDVFHHLHPLAPSPLERHTPSCGYIEALRRESEADVVVATDAAFSQTMLARQVAGEPAEARALVVDEAPTLWRGGYVTATPVSEWMTQLAATKLGVERAIERAADADEHASLVKVHDALTQAAPLLGALHAQLVSGRPDPEQVSEIAIGLAAAGRRATGATPGSARWEAVHLQWLRVGDETSAPAVQALLRAAVDLGWAVEHDTLRCMEAVYDEGGLGSREAAVRFSVPTQIGAELVSCSHPTLIADATPSRALRSVIEAQGGTIRRLYPPLPLLVTRDSSRGWGRGRRGRGAERRAEREAWEVVVRATKMAKRRGRRPAILTHLPWAQIIAERGWWPAELVGHWGADERAHDRWMGMDMVIAGVTTPSPEEAEAIYRAERALALAAGAPEDDWPRWKGERVMRGRRMVPTELAIAEWDADRLAGQLAQAIGRVRSLDHPGAEVLLLGPDIDLSGYGITVQAADQGGGGAKERRQVAHLGRLVRMAEVAADIHEAGKRITRAALRSAGVAARNDLYGELREGIDQYGSARALVIRLRDDLAEAQAASGYKVEVATSEPDASGRCRVLVRAVIDEEWLVHTRRVVGLGYRPAPKRTRISVHPVSTACACAQGP